MKATQNFSIKQRNYAGERNRGQASRERERGRWKIYCTVNVKSQKQDSTGTVQKRGGLRKET